MREFLLFPFPGGAAAFPVQLEQELLFPAVPGLQKDPKMTCFVLFCFCAVSKALPWTCSPSSKDPKSPWDSGITSLLTLFHGHNHSQTFCPQPPWLETPPLGAAGREFLRNETAPKSQFLHPVPGGSRVGRGPPWAAAGHKSRVFPWNSWSVPAPQEGIAEPRTPSGTGIAPEFQEGMGKDHKIPEKLHWEGLSL